MNQYSIWMECNWLPSSRLEQQCKMVMFHQKNTLPSSWASVHDKRLNYPMVWAPAWDFMGCQPFNSLSRANRSTCASFGVFPVASLSGEFCPWHVFVLTQKDMACKVRAAEVPPMPSPIASCPGSFGRFLGTFLGGNGKDMDNHQTYMGQFMCLNHWENSHPMGRIGPTKVWTI